MSQDPRGLSWRRLAALAGLLLGLAWAPPAAACRCAQVPLERYFEAAEIVLVGEAVRVTPRTLDGVEALEVVAEPRFRGSRPFKGSLAGVTLVTPASSARCGLPVAPGELYVIFASRVEPVDDVAWFDSCGGSRLYAGGARADEMAAFVGLPRNLVVPRLFELSGAAPAAADPADVASPFHTSPACWEEPRVFHAGRPEEELRKRVEVLRRPAPPPQASEGGGPEALVSPNGAYRAWVRPPDTTRPGPWEAAVLVDVERDALLWVVLHDPAWAPEVRWINEKLLFFRVHWGRIVASDLILDAERGALVYEEAAHDGALAFQQFRGECAGQCPCAAVPGSRTEAGEPPPSRPAPGEPGAETLPGLVRSLAHLDADWDGRVYSEPGGRVSTLSRLAAERERPEHPVEIIEVRATPTGPWLHVRLYAGNPCTDPSTPAAHAGWVPAYSTEGALVAGTYPGGC